MALAKTTWTGQDEMNGYRHTTVPVPAQVCYFKSCGSQLLQSRDSQALSSHGGTSAPKLTSVLHCTVKSLTCLKTETQQWKDPRIEHFAPITYRSTRRRDRYDLIR
jgi:hypothetical protein